MMDEGYDILPFLQNERLVWYSQCMQLFHVIAKPHIQQAEWKPGRSEILGGKVSTFIER
jgi:hypothetical protein